MQIAATSGWTSADVELFPLRSEHVTQRYVDWLNDPEVNRFLESRFQHHTLESTQGFVRACEMNPEQLFAGIRYRPLGSRHVGNIKLDLNRKHGLAEVGILIGEKEIYGRGVASQAIMRIAGIAREDLGLRRLTAGCYAGNQGSVRAFVKAGFTVECRRPNHFLLDGRPQDLILMGLAL